MKTLLFAVYISSAASAFAISLPVDEDTFTSRHAILTPASGRAAVLQLSTNQAALLKFDLSSLPSMFNPSNIISARLRAYIVTCHAAGDILVMPITSPWTEAVTSNAVMPSFDSTIIGTVSASKVVARHFVSADVTPQVIAALSRSGSNYGFLLEESAGQAFIASKEGPGLGPAAELEIEANLAIDSTGSATFPGSVSIAGDLDLLGVCRQGFGMPGLGLITRRVESTNVASGSIVARTDTVMLERDGSSGGWQIVNTANPGEVTFVATGIDSGGNPVDHLISIHNSFPPATNSLFASGAVIYFRCSFGDASNLGHHTDVSLMRDPNNNGTNWIGNLISTYNQ